MKLEKYQLWGNRERKKIKQQQSKKEKEKRRKTKKVSEHENMKGSS